MIQPAKKSLLILVVLAITACAGAPGPPLVNPLVPQTDQENALDAILDSKGYAGKTSTRRIGNTRFRNWTYIDPLHITVTFGVNKNYLIKFKSSCHNADVAQTMKFDTVMSSIIPGDRVMMGRDTRIVQPCWIDKLYTLEKKPREKKE